MSLLLTDMHLPANYASLTSLAQQGCRRSAVLAQKTPEQTWRAWAAFRYLYFESLPMGIFYKRKLPSPDVHYRWVYAAARYARNLIGAPRSFAKSSVMGIEWPIFLAVTRPNTEILVCCSRDDLAAKRGRKTLSLFSASNEIKDDFGDLLGNWRTENRRCSYHAFDLTNGSTLEYSSVGSMNLGSRPDVIIWDDVEPDPHKVKNWERVVQELSDALFDVYLPMLDGGSSMMILGTLLHRRSLLYWLMTTNDQRLGSWHRYLSAIVDQYGNPEWPEKFNGPTIERLKRELGPAAFNAAYMNAPMASDNAVLRINKKRNFYSLVDEDDSLKINPLSTRAQCVRWEHETPTRATEYDPGWKEIRLPFADVLSGMYRFIAVDVAIQTHGRADFSVVHVMGFDTDNRLWSLDLWSDRASPQKICDKIWEMAGKWKVKLIGVEAISVYRTLYDKVVAQRSDMERLLGFVPRLKAVTYPPHLDKESRIASLEWRCDEGKVLLPDVVNPFYRKLVMQVENFTMSGENLQHDDELDTLSMPPHIIQAPRRAASLDPKKASATLAQRLVAGERSDPVTGISLISGMMPNEIPIRELRHAGKPGLTLNEQMAGALPLEWDILSASHVFNRVMKDGNKYRPQTRSHRGAIPVLGHVPRLGSDPADADG